MLKRLQRQPWTCPQCIRQQRHVGKRRLVTSSNAKGSAAAAAVADDYQPASRAAPSIALDDRTLRQIFDSPHVWKEFSSKTKYHNSGKSAGLFQNRYLTHPDGFQDFAAVTLTKCKRIVAAVLSYQTNDELKRVARALDRLSDLLCRVIDLSDFVRSVHPDRKVQAAASQAYASMFEYMNVLNTTTGLNDQLKRAAAIPEVYNSWSEEERTVAAILIKDFSKSAIDLAETDRQAFEAANDGLATNFNSRDGNALYQLPTIALICDFSLPPASHSNRPTLLSFREVTTLFHEMGHALHSICGRTALQNVSGTRCATDFAELPSVLMENFASAPEVLALYARHWETDAPLDPSRIQERVEVDRRMQGAEIESQVLLGMLDQEYHSRLPLTWSDGGDGRESTKVYQSVWNKYSLVPEPAGTSWQGFFGHLFGYGATYYSYLFDRAIAGKIWRDVFQRAPGGAIDPAAGQLFREEVLRHGGGRDGWRCVAGALGNKSGRLAEGEKGAMEEVGRWGVHS
ncbi:Mitochondrial intermediate peptidase [Friedmanniomyces endolithicus]|uniref:Mitochondrial intermediate peptidase n=1 Tax=Rachicladosporium monterosium TaxID=1507873 RepID=A0ABR0LCM2_9PEZI|nr:Mitochondrial intermediate peptidase [Friedmanniomyces endolithicus]KAK5146821.1 Mitochondrial intermediate peptidase [Rachicladosporium monterosium]